MLRHLSVIRHHKMHIVTENESLKDLKACVERVKTEFRANQNQTTTNEEIDITDSRNFERSVETDGKSKKASQLYDVVA